MYGVRMDAANAHALDTLAPASDARQAVIERLRAQLASRAPRAVPRAHEPGASRPGLALEQTFFDLALVPGVVHEWFGTLDHESPARDSIQPPRPSAAVGVGGGGGVGVGWPQARDTRQTPPARRAGPRLGGLTWVPPLALILSLTIEQTQASSGDAPVLWIGRDCWPSPSSVLAWSSIERPRAGAELLARSVFVDACTPAERVWAVELALRSRAASCVVVDGSRFTLPDSRRLQLAAGASSADLSTPASGQTLALVLRPWWERSVLSSAHARWLVGTHVATAPAWNVELLRCKGLAGVMGGVVDGASRWCVSHDHETCALRVVPELADRPAAPWSALAPQPAPAAIGASGPAAVPGHRQTA
jgi:hypothetical protein